MEMRRISLLCFIAILLLSSLVTILPILGRSSQITGNAIDNAYLKITEHRYDPAFSEITGTVANNSTDLSLVTIYVALFTKNDTLIDMEEGDWPPLSAGNSSGFAILLDMPQPHEALDHYVLFPVGRPLAIQEGGFTDSPYFGGAPTATPPGGSGSIPAPILPN